MMNMNIDEWLVLLNGRFPYLSVSYDDVLCSFGVTASTGLYSSRFEFGISQLELLSPSGLDSFLDSISKKLHYTVCRKVLSEHYSSFADTPVCPAGFRIVSDVCSSEGIPLLVCHPSDYLEFVGCFN